MILGGEADVKGIVSDLTPFKAWISPEIGEETQLSLSVDGSFSAKIRLSHGLNRIAIVAEDAEERGG